MGKFVMGGVKHNNKIESLDALRGIAFLGIFFLHSGFYIQWSQLAVSIFFALSGFLLVYRNYDDSEIQGGVSFERKICGL